MRLLPVLLVAVLTACGSSSGTGGGRADDKCPAVVTRLVDRLGAVRELQLNNDFQTLADAVSKLKATYDTIVIADVPTPCLLDVATSAEEAMNAYLVAFGRWSACGVTCAPTEVTGFSRAFAEGNVALEKARRGLD